jgi:ABC-type uncharacterized transport system permease subunit
MVMKKLSVMVLALTSVLGFSMAAALPSLLAIGFILQALGNNVLSQLLSAIPLVLSIVLGVFIIDPLIL